MWTSVRIVDWAASGSLRHSYTFFTHSLRGLIVVGDLVTQVLAAVFFDIDCVVAGSAAWRQQRRCPAGAVVRQSAVRSRRTEPQGAVLSLSQ